MTDETRTTKRVNVNLPNFAGVAGLVIDGECVKMAYSPKPGAKELVVGETYEVDGKQMVLDGAKVSDFVRGMMVYELTSK